MNVIWYISFKILNLGSRFTALFVLCHTTGGIELAKMLFSKQQYYIANDLICPNFVVITFWCCIKHEQSRSASDVTVCFGVMWRLAPSNRSPGCTPVGTTASNESNMGLWHHSMAGYVMLMVKHPPVVWSRCNWHTDWSRHYYILPPLCYRDCNSQRPAGCARQAQMPWCSSSTATCKVVPGSILCLISYFAALCSWYN